MMKQLVKKLIGTTDDCSFEEMLYHGICLFGFVAVLMLAIGSLVSQAYISVLFSLLFSAFLGTMYFLARFKRYYLFFGLYSFSTLLAIAEYFFNVGIYGPTPYIFLMILVLAVAYNPVKLHIRILLFHVTVVGGALLMEIAYPNLVMHPYKTPELLRTATIIGIMVSLFMSFIGMYFLRRSYDNERKKNMQQRSEEHTSE